MSESKNQKSLKMPWEKCIYFIIHCSNCCEQHRFPGYHTLSYYKNNKINNDQKLNGEICNDPTHDTYNFKNIHDGFITFHDTQGKCEGMISSDFFTQIFGINCIEKERYLEKLNKLMDKNEKYIVESVHVYDCDKGNTKLGFKIMIGDRPFLARIGPYSDTYMNQNISRRLEKIKLQYRNSKYDLSKTTIMIFDDYNNNKYPWKLFIPFIVFSVIIISKNIINNYF